LQQPLHGWDGGDKTMKTRRLLSILWPAFLVAGILEILIFAMVDPQELQWFGQPITLSRAGVYTVAFFVFWAVVALSSAMTALLSTPAPTGHDAVPD